MIPIDQVTVLSSPPRVLQFPATAAFSHLGLKPKALNLVVKSSQAWPMVSIDAGPPSQAATLWVFLKIGGQWFAAGAERLRPGQLDGEDKPEDENVNRWIANDWLFDSRWGPMAGHVPAVGAPVGMMVAAGSSRSNDDQAPVQERTPVIEFAWPGSQGAATIDPVWVEGQPAKPDPVIVLPRPELTDTIIARLDAIDRKLEDLGHRADAQTAAIREHITRAVHNLEASTASLFEKKKGPTP